MLTGQCSLENPPWEFESKEGMQKTWARPQPQRNPQFLDQLIKLARSWEGYSDGKTIINHPSNNHHKWMVSSINHQKTGWFIIVLPCFTYIVPFCLGTPMRQQPPNVSNFQRETSVVACWLYERSSGARQFCCWPFDCSHKQQIDKASPQARLTTEINQVEKKSARHCTESQNWQMSWKKDISETFWIIFMLPYVKGHVQARHCPTSPSGRLEARLDSVKCSHCCRFKGRLRAHWMLQALNRRGFHIWLWGWSCSKVQRSLLCLDGILLLPSALRAHL